MSEVEVDFTNTADVDFELIPPGWYDVLVYDVGLETSQSGMRMFKFEFNLLDMAFAGRKVWLRNTIGAKDNNWYLKRTLNALGYEAEGVVSINTNDLMGREAQVRIEHEEYSGKTREKVVDIRPNGMGDTDDIDLETDLETDIAF